MSSFTVTIRTQLRASADEVWAHASTMDGVNEEISPWVRMSVPASARGQRLADAPVGREAFTSVLLLFGIFPFDVHHLTLARLYSRGFNLARRRDNTLASLDLIRRPFNPGRIRRAWPR